MTTNIEKIYTELTTETVNEKRRVVRRDYDGVYQLEELIPDPTITSDEIKTIGEGFQHPERWVVTATANPIPIEFALSAR